MIPEPIEHPADPHIQAWLTYELSKTLPLKKRIRCYHEAFSLAVAVDDKSLQTLVLTKLAQNARLLEKRVKRYEQALETAQKIMHCQVHCILELLHAISHDSHLSTPQRMRYCTQILCGAQDKKNITVQADTCYELGNMAPTFIERLQYYNQALIFARASKNPYLEKSILYVQQELDKEHETNWRQQVLNPTQSTRDLRSHCQLHQELASSGLAADTH